MKYTIYWTDNARCANRGSGEDTFSKDVFDFKSDREALIKAIEIQNNYDLDEDNYEDLKDLSDEELKFDLYDIDLGFGDPVVFWIKKGSKKIYDAGISLKDWN